MRYTVMLEAISDPQMAGWYYARIPTLDLTTHGEGIDGALAAAADLAKGWIAERRERGESVPVEEQTLVGHIVVADAVQL